MTHHCTRTSIVPARPTTKPNTARQLSPLRPLAALTAAFSVLAPVLALTLAPTPALGAGQPTPAALDRNYEVSICDRTAAVRDAILALATTTSCESVSLGELADITSASANGANLGSGFHLRNEGLTTLKPGDFKYLSGLTTLWLDDNQLTHLPAGAFDITLAALTTIRLDNNKLRTSAPSVFNELPALTAVVLDGNELDTLPADMFTDLTRELVIRSGSQFNDNPDSGGSDQPTANAKMTLSLVRDGNALILHAPSAVPFDLTVNLDIGSGPTTINVPMQVGQTTATRTLTGSSTQAVAFATPAVTVTNLPTTGAGAITGLDYATATAPTGICNRTAAVQTALIAKVSASACSNVTIAMLNGISGTLDLSDSDIGALLPYDFLGLTGVTTLNLSDNQLTTPAVPPSIFAPLTAMTTLNLSGNELFTLPDGIFKGVPATLTSLDIRDQFRNSTSTTIASLQMPASLNLTGTTATLTIAAGAPLPLTFPLYLSGHNEGSSPTSVSIAAGATTGTVNLVAASGQTLTAALSYSLPSMPGVQGLTLFLGSAGICDRTEAVRNAIVAHADVSATNCGFVTAEMLAGIGSAELSITGAGVTSVKVGDFAGLSGLIKLRLASTSITELPSGIFNGLASLEDLNFLFSDIITVPPDLFAPIRTTLQQVNFGGNNLKDATFPDGLFVGLPRPLDRLTADRQGTASVNATMRVILSQEDNAVTATLPSGAPGNTTVNLAITGATASGSPTSISIPVGTTSATVTLLPQGSATPTAAFAAPTPVDLGVDNYAGAFDLQATAATVDICDRTAAVEAALLAAIGGSPACDAVPASAFQNITGTLDLSNSGISALLPDDFLGLTAITTLNLSDNQLTDVPASIFAPLQAMTTLNLSGNELSALPDGIFKDLPMTLTSLDMSNQFKNSPSTTIANLPMPSLLNLNGTTATLTIAAGAPLPLTFPLYLSGNAGSSPTSVSIATGATTGTVNLVAASGQTLTAALDATNLPTLTGVTGLTLVGEQGGICDRTPVVRHAIVAHADVSATTCGAVTTGMLAGLGAISPLLQIQDASVTSLKAGDFAGLSSLTELSIATPLVTELPSGIFTGLSKLEDLSLLGSKISVVPSDLLAPMKATLDSLNINSNNLKDATFPDGLFLGLADPLTALMASAQFAGTAQEADATMRVNLSQSGNEVTATLPSGAPGNTTVNLAITGATASGSPTSILIPVGTTSTTVTLLPQGIATPTAAFAATTPVDLGVATYDAALDLQVIDFTIRICDRTAQVEAALLAAIGNGATCGSTRSSELRAITGTLDLSRDAAALSGMGAISTLKEGDFANLGSVQGLDLSGQSLSTLTADTFTGLSALTTLNLRDNLLTTVPASIFSPLAELTDLDLSGNALGSLPAGIFTGLSAITTLSLHDNLLTTVPAGIFTGLSALTTLNLRDNLLTTVPASIFAPLVKLPSLDLSGNQFSTLPTGIFTGLAALATLNLRDNLLTTVPANIFAPLVKLTDLDLSGNEFSTLPDNLFTGLTLALTTLDLSGQFRNDSNTPSIDNFEAPLTLSVTNNVATVAIATGAPVALTATLNLTDAATSTTSVLIPVGTTSGTATLTPASPGGTVSATLSALTHPVFSAAGLTLTLPGICSRTAQVQTALLAAVSGSPTCYSVSRSALQGITGTLDLSSDAAALNGLGAITALAAGDFANLDGVQGLDLSGQSLSALTTSTFTGLSAVTSLDLRDNALVPANVAAGSFAPLVKMTDLNLSGNELGSLPAGIFSGLTLNLTTLDLSNQFGNDGTANNEINSLPLTLIPSWASDRITVTVPAGAPADLTVMLTAVGGTSNSATVTVAKGATSGTTALAGSGGYNVALALAAAPTWPSGTTFASLTFGTGICGRTPQVQISLIAAIRNASNCAEVTPTHLASLRDRLNLDSTRNPLRLFQPIATLKSGDFAGLTKLRFLRINKHNLTALTADTFTGLTNLVGLYITDNRLTEAGLPASVFSKLRLLNTLILSGNQLASLPAGIFSGLSVNLTDLDLSGQFRNDNNTTNLDALPLLVIPSWADGTATVTVPAGAPAPLTVSLTPLGATTSANLTVTVARGATTGTASVAASSSGTPVGLILNSASGTSFSSAPLTTGICNRTPQVRAALVAVISGAGNCAEVTTAQLQAVTSNLDLSGDAAALSGLAAITTLMRNDLQDLTQLATLDLSDNQLTGASFATLDLSNTGFTGLNLSGNQISSLPEDFFSFDADHVDLTSLDLSNQFGNDGIANNEINSFPLTVNLTLTGNTVKVRAPLGVPADLNVSLLITGATESSKTLTITEFTQEATATLTASGSDGITVAYDGTPTFTGSPTFVGLPVTPIVGDGISICDRTDQVEAALLAAIGGIACNAVSESLLQGITGTLDLSSDAAALTGLAAITALADGDFAHLSGVQGLDLGGQSLSTLSTSTFTGLSAVTTLNLGDNALLPASVAAGSFTPLVKLTSLDLRGNELGSLPAGIFTGLTLGLTSLDLSNQFGNDGIANNEIDSLPLTVKPSWAGDRVTVTVPAGAPADLTVMLTAVGSNSNSATVTVLKGTTSSTTALASSGLYSVALALAATPAFTGTPSPAISGLTINTGICDRTPQVQLALVAAISGAGNCAEVTSAHLASLSADLDLSGGSDALSLFQEITALKAGDFAGLTNLTNLNLEDHSLSALSADLFTGLTSLTELDLSTNRLTVAGLPAGVFSKLVKLERLHLAVNLLSALPTGIFTDLSRNLSYLDVAYQFASDLNKPTLATLPLLVIPSWADGTATITVPAGAPAPLTVSLTPVGATTTADLSITVALGATTGTASVAASDSGTPVNLILNSASGTSFNTAPITTGICDRTPMIQTALLAHSAVTAGNCAEVTQSMLAAISGNLNLSNIGLTALRRNDLQGLTQLTTLDLSDNRLTGGAFATLALDNTAFTRLDLSGNTISSLPDNFFRFDADNVDLAFLDLSDQFGNDSTANNEINAFPLAVNLTLTGSTLRVRAPLGVPADLRVPLLITGATSPPQTLTIAEFTQEATATLTASGGGSIAVAFDGTPTWPSGSDFTGLTISPVVGDGICGRTAEVQAALLAAIGTTDCRAVSAANLQSLTSLDLSGDGISALKVGDFAGLTDLTTLNLSDNQLTAVPDGLFTGLGAVTTLNLRDNQLTTVPAGILSPLAAMTSLDLRGNEFATLPDGLFTGLTTALTSLDLSGQFSNDPNTTDIDNFDLSVQFSLDGTNNLATVTIATGAPAPLTVALILSGHDTSNSPTAVTIATGAISGTATLIPATPGGTITAAAGTVSGFTGTGLTLTAATGLCNRTPQVQTAILDKLSGVSNCAVVTPTLLNSVAGSLDLQNKNLSALNIGDFDNLISVTTLNLRDNQLTTVPAGVFKPLTTMSSLDLRGNEFASLPDDLFTGLTTALTTLDLSGQFSNDPNTADIDSFEVPLQFSLNATSKVATVTIPTGAPAPLTVNLDQHGQAGSSPTSVTIAVGATSGTAQLVQASGATLAAELSAVAPTVAGATGLTLSTGVTGICDRTAAVQTAILAGIAGVSNCAHITDTLLKGITGTFEVAAGSTFAGGTLQAGDFAGLSNVTEIRVRLSPSLTTLPSGLLSGGLDSLIGLNIVDDKITALPADLLQPVKGTITKLWLGGNEIRNVPDGFFAGLHSGGLSLVDFRNQFDDSGDGVDTITSIPLPLTVARDADTGVTTVTMPSGAPGTMTITVRATNASPTDRSVTLAAGATTATTTIAAVDGNSPVAVGFASVPTTTTNTFGAVTFPVALIGGICDRTAAVQTALIATSQVSVGICSAVTPTMLNAITSLDLSSDSISTLKAGDFADLTALTTLNLRDNSLTALPAGTFTDLGEVTSLNLADNQLTAAGISAAVFAPLAKMTSLDLGGNELASLPDGIFSNLTTALTSLDVSDQFGNDSDNSNDLATLPLTLIPSWAGGTATITVPAGAPAPLTVMLTAVGGNSANATITVALAATTGTVAVAASGAKNVGLALAATPTWPSGTSFTGLTLAPGICDRTPQVQTALVAAISGAGNCAAVTATQLAALTSLDLSGDATALASSPAISALKSGDFAGLTELTGLALDDQSLTALTAGTFTGLGKLTSLNLADNQLAVAGMPTASFAPLAKMTSLDLSGNELASLPAGIFSSLTTALTSLDVSDQFGNDSDNSNDLATLPLTLIPSWTGGTATITVPAGAPAPLTVMLTAVGSATTSTTVVVALAATTGTVAVAASGSKNVELALAAAPTWPSSTTFTGLTLAPGICDRTPQVQTALVAAISGAGNCAEITAPQLAALSGNLDLSADATALASSPPISALKSGDLAGLTELTGLALDGQSLTALVAGTFTGLGKVTSLNLGDNQLAVAGMPAAIFAPLALMTSLDLSGNEFASLPTGLFSSLSVALTSLDVSDQFGNDSDNSNDLATLPLLVIPSWAGGTATVTVPAGAPAPLTVMLTAVGGNSANATVTVATGATTGTVAVAASGSKDVGLALAATPAFTGSPSLTGLTISTGICDRTPQVQTALVAAISGAGNCAAVTATQLAALTGLDLGADATALASSPAISALKSGDLAGLTELTGLALDGQSLTALTAATFTGLGKLTSLNLRDNQLTVAGISAAVFAPLAKMTSLDLGGNELASLPDGIFSSLTTALTSLDVSDQFGNDNNNSNDLATLPLTLTPSWAGGTATVRVPAGAPAPLTVMLTAVGSATTSTSVVVALAATTGTVAVAASGSKDVGLALAATPTWPSGTSFTGLTISTGICDRTPQVQTALVAAISGAGTCAEVTPTQLAALTSSLDLSYDATALTTPLASSPAISTLKTGDFADLGKITGLNLRDNQLTTVPASIFAPLSKMTSLDLRGNEFRSLPGGIFSGLTTALTILDLSGQFSNDPNTTDIDNFNVPLELSLDNTPGPNRVATVTLSTGAPVALTVNLGLTGQASSSPTSVTIPIGATSGTATLIQASGQTLTAALSSTPPTVPGATGLTLTTGTVSICDRTAAVETALLTAIGGGTLCNAVSASSLRSITGTLNLSSSSIGALQDGDFSYLTGVTTLNLSDNQLTTVPAGVFADLSATTSLNLRGNQFSTLPAGSFTGLGEVTTLDLSDNQLTTVPSGAFTPLAKMTSLDLSGNEFASLPTGLFAGLSLALTSLDLSNQFGNDATPNNEIDSLPLTLIPSWAAGTATVTVPAGAPAPLTVMLTAVGGNSANATITLAAGATTGTVAVAASGGKNVALALAATPAFTGSPSFTGLTISTGICDRTPQVQTALVAAISGAGNCAAVTATQLAALTSLDLSGDATALASSPAISALKSSDFAGLTELTGLALDGQSLTALPAATFTGLGKLTSLNLADNQLTVAGISAAVFAPLAKMTSLDLGGNELASLPDGIFSSLTTALTTLDVSDQFGNDNNNSNDLATLPLTLIPSWAGGTATVRVPAGAPAPLTVMLTAVGGNSANATITVALAATTGTVAVAASGSKNVELALAATPTWPSGTSFTGLTISTGICDRTPQVQTALVAAISGAGTCAAVTATQLAALTSSLDLSADATALASSPPISALKSGDFAGLTALTGLALDDQSLTALPTGIFTGLTALTTLNLRDNQLTTVPASIFAPLAAMTSLDLSGNRFASLPDDLFTGLTTALTTLDLSGQFSNDPNTTDIDNFNVPLGLSVASNVATLSIATGAPAALTVNLDLTGASTSTASVTIPIGATSGTATLTPASPGGTVTAALNPVAPTVSGATGLTLISSSGICNRTAQVEAALLAAVGGGIVCNLVDESLLQGITGTLDLSSDAAALNGLAAITALADGDLANLSGVQGLDLGGQSLSALTTSTFTGLSAVTTLNLSDNALLPANVAAGSFGPLVKLTSLDLGGNELGSLPAGIFTGLTLSLTALDLSNQFGNDGIADNEIATLPLTLIPSWAGGTATITVPAGAPADLTVMLTAVGGNSANATITVAAGATTGTVAVAASGSKNVELALAATPTFTGSPSFSGLTFGTGICDRTPQVQTALVAAISGAGNCAEVTATQLAALSGSLDLSGDATALASSPAITTLKAGDFADLTALTGLALDDQSLTALPAGIFSGLGSLTTLNLRDNKLTAAGLPNDLLDPLVAMTSLDLAGNELSALPADIFTGLTTELTTLKLSDQFNDNDSGPGGDGTPTQASLTVYLTLVQNGNTVIASIPTGAPANLRVNLAITGNAMSSSPATIAIDVGTDSGTATLLPAAGESLLAAIDTTTPVTLSAAATSHTGMVFESSSTGICTRTSALQSALLAHSAITASTCAEVTATMLQGITGELNLSGLSIATLRLGDFADLTGVTTLNLSGNSLTGLTTGILTGLTALTTLNLSDNQLAAVPAGILSPLTGLTSLDLSGNQFAALPNGLFQGLSGDLQTLDLSGQFRNDANTPNIDSLEVALALDLTSDVATVTIATGAPRALTVDLLVAGATQAGSPTSVSIAAGATTGTATLLPQSGVTLIVDLDRAKPPALPATYSGLTLSTGTTDGFCGRSLLVRTTLLAQVSATTCEAVTDSMLASISAALDMSSMGISALQPADLAGLDSVTALDLSDNSIAELPAGIFDDLDAVTALDLSGNQIAELPAGIFSDLDTLDDLDLTGNPGAPFPFEVALSIVAPSPISASQSVSPAGAGSLLPATGPGPDRGRHDAGASRSALVHPRQRQHHRLFADRHRRPLQRSPRHADHHHRRRGQLGADRQRLLRGDTHRRHHRRRLQR